MITTAEFQRTLARDAAVVSAVTLHGRGPDGVLALRGHLALHTIGRAIVATMAARRLELDTTLVDQSETIFAWFVERPRSELESIAEEPAFGAWLAMLEAGLAGPVDNARSEYALALLPIVLLSHLAKIDQNRTWRAHIPASRLIAPLNSQQSLSGDLPVEIEAYDQSGILKAGNKVIARFDTDRRLSFVTSNNSVKIADRHFLPFDIQLIASEDAPELCHSGVAAPKNFADAEPASVVQAVLRGLDVLCKVWPECVPDILAFVRGIVAIDLAGSSTFSASAPAAPGIILLTVRADEDPEMVAECLVHEVSHLKLDALWTSRAILTNDDQARFRHPWRPDPRPMRGVFLGAHAFMNVAEFALHSAQRGDTKRFGPVFLRVRDEVEIAMTTLREHGQFTVTGAELFADMEKVLQSWNHVEL